MRTYRNLTQLFSLLPWGSSSFGNAQPQPLASFIIVTAKLQLLCFVTVVAFEVAITGSWDPAIADLELVVYCLLMPA